MSVGVSLCITLLCVHFMCPAAAGTLQELTPSLQAIEPWMIKLRRQLHENPELGFELNETTKAVRAELDSMGIPFQFPVATSGIVATIGSGSPVVVLRADMDALPIQEPEGLPFRSKHPGRMHACGHDVHTTMLLGAARLLKEREAQLQGSVRLVFQPAEELGQGAKVMIREGALEGASVAFAFHVMPTVDSGMVTGRAGVLLSGATVFSITLSGRGGHGALPWQSVDPVLAAAHMITALQALISRESNPVEAASVLSVTKLEAGTAFNVIPNTATLHGTIRSLDKRTLSYLLGRVKEVAEGVAASFRCSVSIDWHGRDDPPSPPTVNDAATFKLASEVVESLFGQPVQEVPPWMATEDFAYFGDVVPSTMLFLGIRNETVGSGANLHHPDFKVDESVLSRGAALHAALAMQYLQHRQAAAGGSKDEL